MAGQVRGSFIYQLWSHGSHSHSLSVSHEQPCTPVPKMDWLVLYSTQQWNFYMNSLYEAIESAINIVRGKSFIFTDKYTELLPISLVTDA